VPAQRSAIQEERFWIYDWRAIFHPRPLQYQQEQDLLLLLGAMASRPTFQRDHRTGSFLRRTWLRRRLLSGPERVWRLQRTLPGSDAASDGAGFGLPD